jgi:transketolase
MAPQIAEAGGIGQFNQGIGGRVRKQFKDTTFDLATKDDKVVIILGDISHFLFMPVQEKFPTRVYNMGICENALISVTAGLSAQGFHPFVHTINPFLTERCVEHIKDDLCYNSFGANIVSTGASFDYAWDGATHHCYDELAILRLLPGMEVTQPGNRKELDTLIRSQYNNGKPTYFRLSDHGHNLDVPVEFGKANILKDTGSKLTVMTAGPIVGNVMEAVADMPVNLVYFSTIKPIDKEVIARFKNTKILVVHDAHGLQEAIHEVPDLCVSYHGLPDKFLVCYGTIRDIQKMIGLDPAGIREAVRSKLSAIT